MAAVGLGLAEPFYFLGSGSFSCYTTCMKTTYRPISVRIPLELHAQLLAEAERDSRPISTVLLLALKQYLAEKQKGGV